VKAVLITGSGGFIGGQLARHFVQAGARVVALASSRGGLNAQALTQAVAGQVPDAIIHAAGSGTVAQVTAGPAQELPANLQALLAVLEFARQTAPQAHVVLLSSAALYGDAPALPQNESQLREPVSLYGLAKAQTEQIVAFYAHRHGLRASAVRLFSVYGPGLRKQLLWDAMNRFMDPASGPGGAEFFGTGQELRDWVHIVDVGRFMQALLARPSAPAFDVFNCAGGSGASTAEVLSHLARCAGAAAPRFNGQTRVGDPQALLADCSKAQQQLGWRPQVAWREGVAEYARWFLQEGRP
jgi:UDP-glucose 4-epimerase